MGDEGRSDVQVRAQPPDVIEARVRGDHPADRLVRGRRRDLSMTCRLRTSSPSASKTATKSLNSMFTVVLSRWIRLRELMAASTCYFPNLSIATTCIFSGMTTSSGDSGAAAGRSHGVSIQALKRSDSTVLPGGRGTVHGDRPSL